MCNHTTNELSQHVERDLDTSHGLDDTDRDDEDQSKEDTIRHGCCSCVCRPCKDTSKTASCSNKQYSQVPDFGNFGILAHKLHVDIAVLSLNFSSSLGACLLLLERECLEQTLEAHDNLISVEDGHIGDSGCVHSEKGTIDDRVGGTEVSGRVVHVLFVIVHSVRIKSSGHIVS